MFDRDNEMLAGIFPRKEVKRGSLNIGITLIQKELHRMETALRKGRVNEADKGQVLEKIHGLKAVLERLDKEDQK